MAATSQPLVHPDPKNPRELARSAVCALTLACSWARKPGRYAGGMTRYYVRRGLALLRRANSLCAMQPEQRS